MRKFKRWTEEEIEFLEEKWGAISRGSIAKNLNRTISAVTSKSVKLGLGNPLMHIDGLTISQLSKVLNVDYGIIRNWIDKYDLPARYKNLAIEKKTWIISYEDFWNWSEQNKQMIDFSRLDRLAIGPEPEWVDYKRKADRKRLLHKPNPHNTPWSPNEDLKLRRLLMQNKYTYPELSKELKRGQAAIKRRTSDLGIKIKPKRIYNHNKYSKEDEKTIVEMMNKGYCFEEIASSLGKHRSAMGVRGKAERMGYKFKNGVPYKIIS